MLYNICGLPDLARRHLVSVKAERFKNDPFFVESLIRDQVVEALSMSVEKSEPDGSAYYTGKVLLRFPITIKEGFSVTVPLLVDLDFEQLGPDFMNEESCRVNEIIAYEVRRAWTIFRIPVVVADAVEVMRRQATISSPDRTSPEVLQALKTLEILAGRVGRQMSDLIDLRAVFSASHDGRPATPPDRNGLVVFVAETGRLDIGTVRTALRDIHRAA
jgi:hypothetical protein